MNLSLSMEYVLLRAAQEASAFSYGKMAVEHLFLGILKLPEVSGDEVITDKDKVVEFDQEKAEVAEVAGSRGWDTAAMRQKLRSYLSSETIPSNAEEQITYILGSAAYHAQQDRASESVSARDVLMAILRHPTPMISSLLNGKLPSASGEEEQKQPEPVPPEPEGIAFLPVLTSKIRNMRYELLNDVYGQDHAVHALTEGIFSAEVLAASDGKRKGPRAVFVFAGPPGVGKTFMAERAAAALRLPCKRFDMSSYADHQAHMNLIGFAPSFKDAKPGQLTDFVASNPRCILLIDEIEKANQNTIQLFLQILDGGRLHDDYTDKDVDFRDTIIIFTTNAGKQLYADNADNLSVLPRQSIISALRTDINPATNQPYFPAAICSRLSTGFVLMFNHLKAFDLESICETELKRFCAGFEKQYGIRVSYDRLLPMALLYSEGTKADARTLRAQTELFCKREIFRLCRMWGEEHFEKALSELKEIHFSVNTQDVPQNIRNLFVNSSRPEIMLFCGQEMRDKITHSLPEFNIFSSVSEEEAFKQAEKTDPLFILVDMQSREDEQDAAFNDPFSEDDWDEDITTKLLMDDDGGELVSSFDNIPLSAGKIHTQVAFLRQFNERNPSVPVYLLESADFRIDDELMSAFSRLGVRGKLLSPANELDVFREQLQLLAEQCYLQKMASSMGAEQQVLCFSTEPLLSQDSHTAAITLTDLALKRAVDADDVDDLLDNVERSNVHFEDVIGADEAKDELKFFVDYLKNPRGFIARGLKPPKGVLLYGPPGTGKTMLARAMAGEANVAFIATEATNFVTKWQGSGPESIRTLFKKARRYAPSIVFIDEIDAIGRARGASDTGHAEKMTLNALLTEMDGFHVDPRRPVFVLAATNFSVDSDAPDSPGSIDPALSRRFDRKILVELPNRENRRVYLEKMIGKETAVTEAMLSRMASRSVGMSLADLSAVLEQAARMAVRKNKTISDEELDEAFELTKHGSEKNWGESYTERVAYHESGHALLCYLAGRTPAYLTIVARGSHGGYMEHADTEDTPLRTREQVAARIRTALGGRAAELVRYGSEEGISTGASGDLDSATRLASAMLLNYGMDSDFGLASLSTDVILRSPMAERYLIKLNTILSQELASAVELLNSHRPQLDALAQALLQKNKLTGDEIAEILS